MKSYKKFVLLDYSEYMRKQQVTHSDKTETMENLDERKTAAADERKTAAADDTDEVNSAVKRKRMSVKDEDNVDDISGAQTENSQDTNAETDLSKDNFFLDDIKKRRKLKEQKSSTNLKKRIENIVDKVVDDDVFSFAKQCYKENKKQGCKWMKIKF